MNLLAYSRQDKNTTEPPAGRGQEAAMAAVRTAVVRRLHDTHHRQLCQGRDPYVLSAPLFVDVFVGEYSSSLAWKAGNAGIEHVGLMTDCVNTFRIRRLRPVQTDARRR